MTTVRPGMPAMKTQAITLLRIAARQGPRAGLAGHLGDVAAKSNKISQSRKKACLPPFAWRALIPPMRQPPSPCIGVCRIVRVSGWCEGCLRTLDEIADWPILTVREKDALLLRLDQRRLNPPQSPTAPSRDRRR